jgi:hypothetical protein
MQNDTILLNHDAPFHPKKPPQAVDVSDQVPEMRRLIRAGQYRQAAGLMPVAYTQRTGTEVGSISTGRDPYQPFCAVQLTQSTDGPFREYRLSFATN